MRAQRKKQCLPPSFIPQLHFLLVLASRVTRARVRPRAPARAPVPCLRPSGSLSARMTELKVDFADWREECHSCLQCRLTSPSLHPYLFINSLARGWQEVPAAPPNCLYIIFYRNSDEEGPLGARPHNSVGASIGSRNGGLVSGSLIIISLIKTVRVRHGTSLSPRLVCPRSQVAFNSIYCVAPRRTCNATRRVTRAIESL